MRQTLDRDHVKEVERKLDEAERKGPDTQT
jgi:hypothetical protein